MPRHETRGEIDLPLRSKAHGQHRQPSSETPSRRCAATTYAAPQGLVETPPPVFVLQDRPRRGSSARRCAASASAAAPAPQSATLPSRRAARSTRGVVTKPCEFKGLRCLGALKALFGIISTFPAMSGSASPVRRQRGSGYIVQEPTTKRCSIDEERPAPGVGVIIGGVGFGCSH